MYCSYFIPFKVSCLHKKKMLFVVLRFVVGVKNVRGWEMTNFFCGKMKNICISDFFIVSIKFTRKIHLDKWQIQKVWKCLKILLGRFIDLSELLQAAIKNCFNSEFSHFIEHLIWNHHFMWNSGNRSLHAKRENFCFTEFSMLCVVMGN